jgi:hypothetical protein
MQITKTMAKKIVELEWVSYNTDDLSAGLHPFTTRYFSPDDAKKQRQKNIQNDMLSVMALQPRPSPTIALFLRLKCTCR